MSAVITGHSHLPAKHEPAQPSDAKYRRLLRLVDELMVAPWPLTLSELSRRADLPKSTTLRLLATLCTNNLASRTGNHYLPGPGLLSFAGAVMCDTNTLRRTMAPFAGALHEHTGITISVAVLRGAHVQFPLRLHGCDIWTTADSCGFVPAHATAAGKLLLAQRPEAARRYVGLGLLTPVTRHTITSPSYFLSELRQARIHDIAFSREESASLVFCAAVPVTARSERAVAALTATSGTGEPNLGQVVPLLRHAAFAGSAALRHALTAPRR